MNIICDILSNFKYNPSLKIIQLKLNHLKYLGDKITRKLRDLSYIRISRYLFLKYTINLILSDLISIFVFEKLSSKIDRCLPLEEKNTASLIIDCENHC